MAAPLPIVLTLACMSPCRHWARHTTASGHLSQEALLCFRHQMRIGHSDSDYWCISLRIPHTPCRCHCGLCFHPSAVGGNRPSLLYVRDEGHDIPNSYSMYAQDWASTNPAQVLPISTTPLPTPSTGLIPADPRLDKAEQASQRQPLPLFLSSYMCRGWGPWSHTRFLRWSAPAAWAA